MKTKRSTKPTFALCHKTTVGGHSTTPWTCRSCGQSACAACSQHYGTSRTPVSLTSRDHERLFTCGRCQRASRSLYAARVAAEKSEVAR